MKGFADILAEKNTTADALKAQLKESVPPEVIDGYLAGRHNSLLKYRKAIAVALNMKMDELKTRLGD